MEYENIIPAEINIETIIPHRRPFRFIDRVLEVEFGKSAAAILSDLTTPEYDWLKSHFPSFQVIPGAIILEALAELGAIAVLGMPQNRGKIAVLAEVNSLKFRKVIKPRDNVRLETEITHLRSNFGRGRGRALLENNDIAAEGVISFALTEQSAH